MNILHIVALLLKNVKYILTYFDHLGQAVPCSGYADESVPGIGTHNLVNVNVRNALVVNYKAFTALTTTHILEPVP